MAAFAIALTLCLAQSASAVFSTTFFTSTSIAQGTNSGGGLDSIKLIDGDTLNMTEAVAGATDPDRYFTPYLDNGSGFGWSRNRPNGFWDALDDIQNGYNIYPFTDYNVSLMWSTTNINNQSVKFDPALWLNVPNVYALTIVGVGLYTVDRKNTTGAMELIEGVIDPVGGVTCLSRTVNLTDLAWHIIDWPTTFSVDCNGTPWTTDLLNRTEINFKQASAASQLVSVSSAYWVISMSASTFNLDSYFNLTLSNARSTPYSLNWTCNRTAQDSFVVSAYRNNPVPGWVVLDGNACPTGAQTSDSTILPSGTWLAGRQFSARIQGYGAISPGTVRFDRLVLDINTTAAPNPTITGNNLSLLLLFALAIGTVMIVSYKIAEWRGFV